MSNNTDGIWNGIIPSEQRDPSSTIDRGRNSLWLRHAFMVPHWEENVNQRGRWRRYGSGRDRRYSVSAAFKYTNTTLGGNWAINNPPQFSYLADIPQPGLGREEKDWKDGMGRYYSEALDDTQQIIHMSFGVPQFSSWLSFFTNFYDRSMAGLANRGIISRAMYQLGNVAGYVVSLPLQPFIIGVTATSRVWSFLNRQAPSKWFYFKPTMHSYWSAVNVMANEFAIGLGIVPRALDDEQFDPEFAASPGQRVTDEDRARLHRLFPDIFRENGGIDIFALANRTQRIANRSQNALRKRRDEAGLGTAADESPLTSLQDSMAEYIRSPAVAEVDNGELEEYLTSADYFERAVAADAQRGDNENAFAQEGTLAAAAIERELERDVLTVDRLTKWSELKGLYNFMVASQRDATQFVSFRVNHTGSMSESFNNSTRESTVAQTLNSTVSSGRDAQFNFMGGNVTDLIGSVTSAFGSFVAGALDSVNLSGLATLTGSAFIDIPKLWDGSTANLPRAEYTIPLPSVYGNRLSRFINMYIPIAMVLAGGLPLSAGRSAYTSPFICQIYHQGRVQKQLAIVDSITLTRGSGNVGWNAEHEMLGAELTISVVDLSSILHLPIKGAFAGPTTVGDAAAAATMSAGMIIDQVAVGEAGGLATNFAAAASGAAWDEQSMFSDYMAVLTSLPISETYYLGKRLNLNLTRRLEAFKDWRGPTRWGSMLLDTGPARTLSAFAQTSGRF